MAIADPNIILRYILDDHPRLSSQAAEVIDNNAVTLPIEVACEVVFVMQKVYQIERFYIRDALSKLIDEDLISTNKPQLLLKALGCYGQTKFDFVDCILWAYHKLEQESIFTFDRKSKKYIEKKD